MASFKKPGRSVRGSKTGRPVMALLDLIGRRWTLRIFWELRGENMTFRALREACEAVSPTVLNQRLHELREAKLVELGAEDGYVLTPLGRELLVLLEPITDWSSRWAKTL